jgi:hypothetical protein
MHWAAHGQTAAEAIFKRVSSAKKNIGLTSFKGNVPSKKDVEIAKNYLNEKELEVLNRIVTAYLEMAELQAIKRVPMYMKDWVGKLDDFLEMSGNEVLLNAGKISHKEAIDKAYVEFEKYKTITSVNVTKVEMDFVRKIEVMDKKLKKL